MVLKEYDSSRKFNAASADPWRPVKIDIFYPSEEKPQRQPLTYGDFLDMYELRMDYHVPMDSSKKTSLMLAGMFAEYLHLDSPTAILKYKTAIYDDLKKPAEKLPVIIYAASMNGSSYENVFLFDSLARHGYVVAAISSVGKFPGFMSGAADMEEQVLDILFAARKLRNLPFADTSRIGVLSWSLGGTAAVKAAMLSRDIKCLLSFDGTEIHYYGFDTAWDRQYNAIMKIPPFYPQLIHIPYMYLSSEHPVKVDSVYVFPRHIQSKDNYFLKLNGAIHENFSSIVTVVDQVNPKLKADSGRYQMATALAINFFDEYLKGSAATPMRDRIGSLMKAKPQCCSIVYPKQHPRLE